MLIINGPIRKYVRQVCKCVGSLCVNKTEYSKAKEIEKDKFVLTATESIDVCSKCGTMYEVTIDASSITLITNIGEKNE